MLKLVVRWVNARLGKVKSDSLMLFRSGHPCLVRYWRSEWAGRWTDGQTDEMRCVESHAICQTVHQPRNGGSNLRKWAFGVTLLVIISDSGHPLPSFVISQTYCWDLQHCTSRFGNLHLSAARLLSQSYLTHQSPAGHNSHHEMSVKVRKLT